MRSETSSTSSGEPVLRLRVAVALACAVAACGGTMATQADGGGAEFAEPDSASIVDGGEEGAGGWTQCSAPGDVKICGGQGTACWGNVAACNCPPFTDEANAGESIASNDLATCTSSPGLGYDCPDGTVMVAVPASTADPDPDLAAYQCVPEDVGILYAKNGWSRAVRYADYSLYTGDSVPRPPTSCPSIPGLTLCGGACGSCPSGQVCTGRSPLHPYSFCVPHYKGNTDQIKANGSKYAACGQGYGCFAFTVQARAQSLAYLDTDCIPADMCAAAKNLPGGAQCDTRLQGINGSGAGAWTDCWAP